jgi:glycyl-tRNA synthetase beta chain
MSAQNLLVELFVEELPPKSLNKLGEAFANGLADHLKAQGLVATDAEVTAFATPRRLAVRITDVLARAADKPVSHKLMPVTVGLDAAGNATPALLKRLAAMGLDGAVLAQLKRAPDGKNEALFYDSIAPGVALAAGVQAALDHAIAKLPIPKVMSYQLADGWTSVNFVRPAHGLVALHCRARPPARAPGAARRDTALKRASIHCNWRPPTPMRSNYTAKVQCWLGLPSAVPRLRASSPPWPRRWVCSRCRTTPCWMK